MMLIEYRPPRSSSGWMCESGIRRRGAPGSLVCVRGCQRWPGAEVRLSLGRSSAIQLITSLDSLKTMESAHASLDRTADDRATSSSDVYAVGSFGTILHYGGTGWSEMTSGTIQGLDAVWGTASSDVYAVGDYGIILRGSR